MANLFNELILKYGYVSVLVELNKDELINLSNMEEESARNWLKQKKEEMDKNKPKVDQTKLLLYYFDI